MSLPRAYVLSVTSQASHPIYAASDGAARHFPPTPMRREVRGCQNLLRENASGARATTPASLLMPHARLVGLPITALRFGCLRHSHTIEIHTESMARCVNAAFRTPPGPSVSRSDRQTPNRSPRCARPYLCLTERGGRVLPGRPGSDLRSLVTYVADGTLRPPPTNAGGAKLVIRSWEEQRVATRL